MMTTKTVAETITEMRKERGWTQKQLAEECGVSHQTVWNIEHAVYRPSLRTIRGLAAALDEPIDRFID